MGGHLQVGPTSPTTDPAIRPKVRPTSRTPQPQVGPTSPTTDPAIRPKVRPTSQTPEPQVGPTSPTPFNIGTLWMSHKDYAARHHGFPLITATSRTGEK